jgi:hypothetical protein
MVRRSLCAAALFVCFVAPGAYAQGADLSVSVNGPSTVLANYDTATATVTFTITNSGPATVTDAMVDFSPGLLVNLPKFTCATIIDHVRCTTSSFPPITVQGSGSMDVQQPAADTLLEITATVSSATVRDPNPSNNTGTASEWVRWKSSVSVTGITLPPKMAVPQAADGTTVDTTIYYKVDGPSYATDVKITVSVPGVFWSASWDPSLTCVTPSSTSPGTVCTAKKLGASAGFINIRFSISPSVTAGTTLYVTATMTCSDPMAPPRPAWAGVTILDPAFVMVSADSPASVEQGATFASNVTVENAGPVAAVDAQVVFSVTGSPFTLGQPTAPAAWFCASTSSTSMTCSINSFAPGKAYFSFPIVLPPDVQPGKLLQSVIASSVNDGYPPWRGGAMTWISPEKLPSFRVTIDAPSTVYLGSTATYTITVTNTSVNEATDPVLELSFGSLSTVTWDCSDPRGDRHCGLGDMPGGSSRTIIATLPVVADWNSSSEMLLQAFVSPGTPNSTYYYPPSAPPAFVRSTIEPGPPRRRSAHH